MQTIKDVNGTPCLVDEETGEVLATAYFKTPYNHDTNVESNRVSLECKDPHLTDQSFKDEADINNIIARVMKTQEMPVQLPQSFGDATMIPTLYDARVAIAENNATFFKLHPRIRAQFKNDPREWEREVGYLLEMGHVERLQELGIEVTKPAAVVQAATPAPGGQGGGGGAPAPSPTPPNPPNGGN